MMYLVFLGGRLLLCTQDHNEATKVYQAHKSERKDHDVMILLVEGRVYHEAEPPKPEVKK